VGTEGWSQVTKEGGRWGDRETKESLTSGHHHSILVSVMISLVLVTRPHHCMWQGRGVMSSVTEGEEI